MRLGTRRRLTPSGCKQCKSSCRCYKRSNRYLVPRTASSEWCVAGGVPIVADTPDTSAIPARQTTEPTDSLEHGVGPPISYTGMVRSDARHVQALTYTHHAPRLTTRHGTGSTRPDPDVLPPQRRPCHLLVQHPCQCLRGRRAAASCRAALQLGTSKHECYGVVHRIRAFCVLRTLVCRPVVEPHCTVACAWWWCRSKPTKASKSTA